MVAVVRVVAPRVLPARACRRSASARQPAGAESASRATTGKATATFQARHRAFSFLARPTSCSSFVVMRRPSGRVEIKPDGVPPRRAGRGDLRVAKGRCRASPSGRRGSEGAAVEAAGVEAGSDTGDGSRRAVWRVDEDDVRRGRRVRPGTLADSRTRFFRPWASTASRGGSRACQTRSSPREARLEIFHEAHRAPRLSSAGSRARGLCDVRSSGASARPPLRRQPPPLAATAMCRAPGHRGWPFKKKLFRRVVEPVSKCSITPHESETRSM